MTEMLAESENEWEWNGQYTHTSMRRAVVNM